jgi:hypothetical protein
MAEDEDLKVLGAVVWFRLSGADEETGEGSGDEVEGRPHRPIVPGLSERESGFPTLTGIASADRTGTVRARIGVSDPHGILALVVIGVGMPALLGVASGVIHSSSPQRRLRRPILFESPWWEAMNPLTLVAAILRVSASLLDIHGFRLEHADLAAYRLLLVTGPKSPLYPCRVSISAAPDRCAAAATPTHRSPGLSQG